MRPFLTILFDREPAPETQVHPVDRDIEADKDDVQNFLHFLDRLTNALGWIAVIGVLLTIGAEVLRRIPH